MTGLTTEQMLEYSAWRKTITHLVGHGAEAVELMVAAEVER